MTLIRVLSSDAARIRVCRRRSSVREQSADGNEGLALVAKSTVVISAVDSVAR